MPMNVRRRPISRYTAPLRAVAALLAITLAGCPQSPPPEAVALRHDSAIRNTPAAHTAIKNRLGALADPVPRFESRPIFLQIDGKTGAHGPAIAALPDGESLAAWFSYRGPHELTDADIYLARRSPDGDWSAPQRVIDYPWAAANPVLYAEDSNVWLFHAQTAGGWSVATTAALRSTDGGRTWSAPRPVSTAPGSNVRFPPLRLDDGALLLPAYDDLLSRGVLLRSPDGDRWTTFALLEPAPSPRLIQPCLIRADSGGFLLVARNMSRGGLWTGSSTNGRDWTFSLDSGFPNPGAPAALLRLRTGELVMAFNDSPTHRRPLVVAASLDEGRSWTPPRVLQDAVGDWAYPALCEAADGDVELVYSYDRRHIEYARFNLAWLLTAP
jgi:predicted neuraminidase